MVQCLIQIGRHLRPLLQQSSHVAFSYGNYHGCLDTPGFNYNLLTLGVDNTTNQIYLGMCLPNSCTHDLVYKSLSTTLAVLKLPIYVYDLDSTIPQYHYPYTWVFTMVIVILSLFIILTLAGSIFKKKLPFLKGFDIAQSLKIFKQNSSSDLNILNGIRSLAMMWVVFGHYFLFSITGILNIASFNYIFKKPFYLIVQAGLLSVDVFFFLGGFFLSFVFLRQKSTSMIKYPLAILQRVLRIWPCYILAMMIYYGIFMHLGSGPRWTEQPDVTSCYNMWKSIFFVDNLVSNGQQICMGWGWYLQVDFQAFLVCIAILFLYQNYTKASYYFTAALISFSFFMNIFDSQRQNQKLFTDVLQLQTFMEYFLDVYIKPYTRWTPYFMGLFAGIYYFNYQNQIKDTNINKSPVTLWLWNLRLKMQNNKRYRWIIQWGGIGIMAFVVFIPRTLQVGYEWPQIIHSFYLCFSKPIFIIGMVSVLLPSLLGIKDSFFRTILCASVFNIIAKISFCTYLLHLTFLYQFINSRTEDIYYSINDVFVLYLGSLAVSCLLGFIMTIIVEVPCSYYQKELMKFFKKWGQAKSVKNESTVSLLQSQKHMSSLILNKSTLKQQGRQ